MNGKVVFENEDDRFEGYKFLEPLLDSSSGIDAQMVRFESLWVSLNRYVNLDWGMSMGTIELFYVRRNVKR